MPTYEYRCGGCGARVALFSRSINTELTGVCDRCGSSDLRRLFSTFSVGRPAFDPTKISKERLMDGLDVNDPRSMANFFRRVQDEFQDPPDETMDEIVKRLDYGERPEKALGLDTHDHSEAGGTPDPG